MSSQTADSSRPIVFNTLADLSQRLDDLGTVKVPVATLWEVPEPPEPAHPETPPRFEPRRQALDNWARKWRDGPSETSAGPDTRPRRRERWPMVVGVGAVAWLVLTGGMIVACSITDSARRNPALVPVAQRPAEQVAVSVGPVIDRAADMQEAVDDLAAVPVRQGRPDRVPALSPSDRSTAPAGNGCYGTKIEFVEDPREAARLAEKNRRLMLVLNISGDFEESRFT
jgi:hypothetical protein